MSERGIQIALNQDATDPRIYRSVEVQGISAAPLQRLQGRTMTVERWRTIFQVFVASKGEDADLSTRATPMVGTYQVDGALVRFTPRYPLFEGQHYGARFDLDGCVTELFAIPKRVAPPTQVTRIYPSAELLPENLLRFYIYFSAAMRQGESLRHIHLLDGEHQEVAGAFLDTREELWDSTGTRLTLLFDPGRVKTGLTAHQRLGRALCVGRHYRLLIDQEWRDARGEPLASSAEKPFLAVPAKLVPPDVAHCQLHTPRVGSHSPLSLRFPAPLDHYLLSELIHVCRADGAAVPGTIGLEQAETAWEFLPQNAWTSGHYTIQIDRRLEDLAGNNLHGLFERPSSQKTEPQGRTVSLHFEVQATPKSSDLCCRR